MNLDNVECELRNVEMNAKSIYLLVIIEIHREMELQQLLVMIFLAT